MEFLDRLLGKRTIQVTASIQPVNVSELESSRLLREATRLKDDRRYDEAVITLRKAYAACAREGGASIDTYLRLPMMLQLAGRWDEAWAEFNRLLITDVTGMMNDPEIGPMERSQIYDKMRLHLQREKKHRQAISMAVLSYVNWAIGLNNQRRKEELEDIRHPNSIAGKLSPLLKKANREDRLEHIVQIIRDALADPKNIDQGILVRRVSEVTDNSAEYPE